ncbi:MAG: thioredoxin family protein, partial [Muriicola sp.]
QHPRLMASFLTDNKMSIPKLIMIEKDTMEVLGTWGPLPGKATQLATEYKQLHGSLSPEFKEDLQQWFNKDKGQNILNDLRLLLTLK